MAESRAPHAARIEWIDIAKGLGIMCVVLGHVSDAGIAAKIVYLFHMPLFFILSGYLFRPASAKALYARRKAIHLLIPYLTGITLSGSFFLTHRLAHPPRPLPLAHWGLALLWGGAQFDGYFGVLWFLTCLYLAQQLLNAMMLRLSLRAVGFWMIVLAGSGFLLSWLWPAWSLPLDANVVLVAEPLLFTGVLLKRHPMPVSAAALIGIASFAAGIALLLHDPRAFMDMRVGHYGIPVVSFAIAVGCSIGIFTLSRALVHIRLFGIPLIRLGELSLGIMLIHKVMPVLHHLTHGNPWVVFLWDLVAAALLAYALNWLSWGRLLFLGSEPDFNRLILRRSGSRSPAAVSSIEDVGPSRHDSPRAVNQRQ